MIKYSDKCNITANNRTVEADVMGFRPLDSLTVAIANNKLTLKYVERTHIYYGEAMGMEFTSNGPKTFYVKDGRR
jgi:hypothetical protein